MYIPFCTKTTVLVNHLTPKFVKDFGLFPAGGFAHAIVCLPVKGIVSLDYTKCAITRVLRETFWHDVKTL